MPDRLYAHYNHHGIAEPREHDAPDRKWWIGHCKCGWESQWRFTNEQDCEVDCDEHMRQAASVA